MFSWLAIKLFFGGFTRRLWKVWDFLMDHPVLLAIVLCLPIGFVGGCTYKDKELKALEVQIAEDMRKQEEAAAELKKQGEAKAAELLAENEALKADLAGLGADYENRLAQYIKNNPAKVIRIKVPVPTDPARTEDVVFEDGKLTCRRMPSTFKDTVNDMVDRTLTNILKEKTK